MINFILWTLTICFCAMLVAATVRVIRKQLDN